MSDQVLNGDRDRLAAYLRELADLMGLRDWDIFVSDEPPEDPRHGAACGSYYGRKRAEIRFDPEWPEWSPEDLRVVCVHELLHCPMRPVEEPIANVKDHLGPPVYQVTLAGFTDALEYAVDGIAVAWARTLPLPASDNPGQEAGTDDRPETAAG